MRFHWLALICACFACVVLVPFAHADVLDDFVQGEWVATYSQLFAPLPPERILHGCASFNNAEGDSVLLVHGGHTLGESTARSDMWSWRSGANMWRNLSTTGGAGLRPRCAHAFLLVDDRSVLLAGGSDNCSDPDRMQPVYADAWLYDLRNGTWRALPALPTPLAAAAGFALGDGRVALFGGRNQSHLASDALYVLHTQPSGAFAAPTAAADAWQVLRPGPQSEAWPEARLYAAATRAAGRLLMHGGTAADGRPLGDLWRLQADGTWRMLSTCTNASVCPRATLHAAAGLGGVLLLAGGRDSAALWLQDVRVGEWRQGPALPAPSMGVAAAAVQCDGCRATYPVALALTGGALWPALLEPGARGLHPDAGLLAVLSPLLVLAVAAVLLLALLWVRQLLPGRTQSALRRDDAADL